MKSKIELIQSISDVFNGELHFTIPSYQRGYKWKRSNIETLLNDINEFSPTEDQFYCLQNITITQPTGSYNYNVIDGQQRLTTATLILWHLGVEIKSDKLDYQIRTETKEFLDKVVFKTNKESFFDKYKKWEDVVNEKTEYDKQDIYHIYHALNAINDWFNKHKDQSDGFNDKFLNQTRFIVNNIQASNEMTIFRNLNSGKAEMDGADLVRAILLTYSVRSNDKQNADELKQKRISLGIELDSMELFWSRKEVMNYFDTFYTFSDKKKADSRVSFSKNRGINYLYGLFLASKNDNEGLLDWEQFNWSNNEEAIKNLKDLKKFHRIMMDWYNNRTLYHLLAFTAKHSLTENRNVDRFKKLYSEWEKASSRNDFEKRLKILIQKSLFPREEDIEFSTEDISTSIKQLEYENNTALRTLLLIDIIDHVENESLTYLPIEYFVRNSTKRKGTEYTEDVEHLFPQTPYNNKEEVDLVNKRKSLDDFINTYGALDDFKDVVKAWQEKLLRIKEEELDDFKENVIKDIRTKGYKIDNICNLALLYSSTNRRIGNKPFAEKRKCIFEDCQKGIYMRPHTLNLFMNGLSDEVSKWNKESLTKNENQIIKKIERFFK